MAEPEPTHLFPSLRVISIQPVPDRQGVQLAVQMSLEDAVTLSLQLVGTATAMRQRNHKEGASR
jgi:hypothetical protein